MSGYELIKSRVRPRIVSRKLLLPPQTGTSIATLNNTDQWKFAVSVGAGLKYAVQEHVLLRLDFRDYITTFPSSEIKPAPHNTARGVFEQFTPLFGVSYLF